MNAPCISPDWPAPANIIALTTLRRGGESLPPYGSFNLAAHVGDDDSAVLANRARLSRLLPPGTHVHWLTQVHGTEVANAAVASVGTVADASWSRTPGSACAVLTADCLPVLFCSREGDVVAAAHAGWRGLLEGVLENTVAAMGRDPRLIMAWLGPAIGPGAFEVGIEVRRAFAHLGPQAETAFTPVPGKADKFLADLAGLARIALRRSGVTLVWGGQDCTVSDPAKFYSFRRDQVTGRMASLIWIR